MPGVTGARGGTAICSNMAILFGCVGTRLTTTTGNTEGPDCTSMKKITSNFDPPGHGVRVAYRRVILLSLPCLMALYVASYYFFVTPSEIHFPHFEGDTPPVPFTPAYRVIGHSWSPPAWLWTPMLRLDQKLFPQRWGVYPPLQTKP